MGKTDKTSEDTALAERIAGNADRAAAAAGDDQADPRPETPAPPMRRMVLVRNGADGAVFPGIITRVHSPELVDVTAFPPGHAPLPLTSVSLYLDHGTALDALDDDIERHTAFWSE